MSYTTHTSKIHVGHLQRQQTRTTCIGGCSINTCAHVACSCATSRPCVVFLCRRCPTTACQLKLKRVGIAHCRCERQTNTEHILFAIERSTIKSSFFFFITITSESLDFYCVSIKVDLYTSTLHTRFQCYLRG